MEKELNEILVFDPYFAHVIWGGDRIAKFKGIPSEGNDVGESWEISPMPGRESVVAEGRFRGEKLTDLVERYGKDLMGERVQKRFGGKFPLLIKFIDSRGDLSIQVHPDDALSAKRHGKFGKTEMWYSICPEEGAYLYAGFKRAVTPEEFRKSIDDNTIVDLLSKYYTRPGDVFFLPAGCVHAIGRGNFVCEIQEASDVTYRIYDYNRKGADGKPRELHVAESLDATRFDAETQRLAAQRTVTAASGSEADLVHCPYFNTNLLNVDGKMILNLALRDSFTILIAIDGDCTLETDGNRTELPQGRSALVPASVDQIKIEGCGRLISVYVP